MTVVIFNIKKKSLIAQLVVSFYFQIIFYKSYFNKILIKI